METKRKNAAHRQSENDDPNRVSVNGGGSETSTSLPRLYHTLTACTRCRSRKTRCDAGLPKCGPCERSGTHCEFFDSTKQKIIPRSYVVHLQNKVRELEEEIARREALLAEDAGAEEPNNEDLVRGIGAVKFGDYEHYKEPRYVGSSSGVTVTRLVLESAKKDLEPGEFHNMTFQHRKSSVRSSEFSTRDSSNLVSPEPKLPPQHIGETLVSYFCKKALYMLPVLHEPTFMKEVQDVYEGSTDPFKNFKLKMVLAIGLQKYSRKYEIMADSYFLAGLQHVDAVLDPMDHSTLQCLLVMVQYALVKPTRIAAYHIVGLCVRLCIQLGYHQERTIMLSDRPLDPITKDMRRRLFWTLASMEYGLSHVLGRPSAFATSDAYVDVKFYESVDDTCITAEGILPGPVSGKKLISMHFFCMRRLQAEIRRTLYQNPAKTPKTDQDPWFVQMYGKCVKWEASCPVDDEGSGLSELWFLHRFNNILIFMYRPSPQIPQPSLEATVICYNCAVQNVKLEKGMYESPNIDLTWVFLHQVYTVTLTIIWTIYNPEIRKAHPRKEVQSHISSQIQLLVSLAELWPGAEAAADLFDRLASAAMRNYDSDIKNLTPPPAHVPSAPQRLLNPTQSDGAVLKTNLPSPLTASPSDTTTTLSHDYTSAASTGTADTSNPPASYPSPSPPPTDLQQMIFDPQLMNSILANSAPLGIPSSRIPEWLQGWEPMGSTSSGEYAPPTPGPFTVFTGGEVEELNQQAQHDELMSILESEAVAGFKYDGSGADNAAWNYDVDNFF